MNLKEPESGPQTASTTSTTPEQGSDTTWPSDASLDTPRAELPEKAAQLTGPADHKGRAELAGEQFSDDNQNTPNGHLPEAIQVTSPDTTIDNTEFVDASSELPPRALATAHNSQRFDETVASISTVPEAEQAASAPQAVATASSTTLPPAPDSPEAPERAALAARRTSIELPIRAIADGLHGGLPQDNGKAAAEKAAASDVARPERAARRPHVKRVNTVHLRPGDVGAGDAPVSPGSSKTTSINAAAYAFDEALVGTRVSEGHENFVTAYNMLTGIRVAVSRCNAKLNRELIDADFKEVKHLTFDMSGDCSTPSAKYTFRFKDYAPWVFRHLRELFKLDPADYLMSLTAKYIVSELGSPGKSGSFFYYSRDYRFIIKTVRHSEHKRLREILKEYYKHVRKYPNTLVSQFYGLHRVKLPFGRKIHFVVMNNVFPAVYEMHARYDLKGSTLGRTQPFEPNRPYLVYKDLDWLRRHERIVLGPTKRQQLLKQLEADVKMLERCNVMDYSLLIGIHDLSKGNAALDALVSLREFGPGAHAGQEKMDLNYGNVSKRENMEFAKLQTLLLNTNPTALKNFDFSDDFRKDFTFYKDRGGFQSTDDQDQPREVIYYMGVIDFLTGYNLRKRAETWAKSLVHKRSELSAVPAVEYGERFYRFMCMSVGSGIGPEPDNKKIPLWAQDEAAAEAREAHAAVEQGITPGSPEAAGLGAPAGPATAAGASAYGGAEQAVGVDGRHAGDMMPPPRLHAAASKASLLTLSTSASDASQASGAKRASRAFAALKSALPSNDVGPR